MSTAQLEAQYNALAEAVFTMAGLFELSGQWDQAVQLLETTLAVAVDSVDCEPATIKLMALLGDVLWKRGDDERAFGLLTDAVRMADDDGDQSALSVALYYLGELHYVNWTIRQREDHTQALERHTRALALRQALLDQAGMTHSHARLGTIYAQLGEHEQAETHFQQALRVAAYIKYQRGMVRPLTHIGAGLQRTGDLDAALAHYQKALMTASALNDQEGRLYALCNLAQGFYEQNGDLDEAVAYGEEALDVAQQLDFQLGLARVLYTLGTFYERSGQVARARAYFEQTIEVADPPAYTVYVEAAKRRLAQLDAAA